MKIEQSLRLERLDEVRGFSPSFVKELADKLAELKEKGRLVERLENRGGEYYTKIAQAVMHHLSMQLWGIDYSSDSLFGDYEEYCGQMIATANELLAAVSREQ